MDIQPTGIVAYRCVKCEKIHTELEQTFFTVYGNITIGMSGGIIGNNIDEYSNEVKNASVYCIQCLIDLLINYRE